jgi:hypothetical protein
MANDPEKTGGLSTSLPLNNNDPTTTHHHNHHNHHLNARVRLRHFLHPSGTRVHIADSPTIFPTIMTINPQQPSHSQSTSPARPNTSPPYRKHNLITRTDRLNCGTLMAKSGINLQKCRASWTC